MTRRMLQCQRPAHAGVMFPEGSTCPWCEEPPASKEQSTLPWFLRPGWESRLQPHQPTEDQMIEVQDWYRHHGYPDCRHIRILWTPPLGQRVINGVAVQIAFTACFDVRSFSAHAPWCTSSFESASILPEAAALVNRCLLEELLAKFPLPPNAP